MAVALIMGIEKKPPSVCAKLPTSIKKSIFISSQK